MPAVSGGYMGAGLRIRTKQAPTPARVPVSPAATRPARTVFQKPIGAVSPVGNARSTAGIQRRQAARTLPAEHQLPRFPVLRHYTQPQRDFIRQRTETAVRTIASQRGVHPVDAVNTLYANGDHGTRQTLRTYGRAVRETQQIQHANALGALAKAHPQIGRAVAGLGPINTAQKAAIYRQIAALPKSQVRPGPKAPGGVAGGLAPLASIKGFALSPQHNFLIAAAPGFKALGGGFVKDAISLPRDVVNSAYFAATQPKKAVQQFVKHDPLALLAQGKFKDAAVAFNAHPLDTALEVGGLRGAFRGAGRLAGADTAREAAVVPGTSMAEPRAYSTSPIGRRITQGFEQRSIRQSDKTLAEARQAEAAGELDKAHQLYRNAAEQDPRIASQRYVEHRADVREALSQPAKRRGRAEVKTALQPHIAKPAEGGHIQRLIVEGTVPIRTKGGALDVPAMRRDLANYGSHLKEQAKGLSGKELAANKRLQSRIGESRALTDAELTALAGKSREIAKIANAQETQNVAAKLLDPQEAVRSKLLSYAVRHMGAQHGVPQAALDAFKAGDGPRPGARLLDSTGRPLEPQQIVAHMKAHGVNPEDVAFVSQRGLGPGAFNVRSLGSNLTAKGLPTRTRTGAAVQKGLVDTHPAQLEANAVRMQQVRAAHENYVKAIGEAGARKPSGSLRTFSNREEAQQFLHRSQYDAQGNRIHGAPEWRIVRINPLGGREAQLRALIEHGDASGYLQTASGVDHPVSSAIADAVGPDAIKGDGPFAAVPAAYADRIANHADVYRASSPVLRSVTTAFRHATLPLSSSWLLGNVAEAAVRSVIRSPRVVHNLATFRRVSAALQKIDPEAAAHLHDAVGVGHYGMTEVTQTFTSAQQFARSPKPVRVLAESLAKLRHTPGPKQVADAFTAYTNFVFHVVNSGLEHPFREAQAGAHLRSVFGDPGSMAAVSHQAVLDAAKGLRDTNAQVKLADAVRRSYGQYEAFSPGQRKFIALYSPYAAWTFNAANFLFRVLPRDHPALTALIAVQNRVSEQWRTEHGLTESAPKPVPGFLMGTVPVAAGHLNVTRFTPFGVAQDPANSVASLLLPQFSSSLAALRGQKWTGQPLKAHGEATTPEKFWAAFTGELSATVPFYTQVQRFAAGQGSPEARLLNVVNPVRTIKKRASKVSSGGSGGAFGGLPGGTGGSASFGGLPG